MNWLVAGSGFGIALGLIAAIGAQNAHVLRQGIARRQVPVTLAICIICDTILMASGVCGMGTIATIWPPFEWITRIGGAIFLIGYGAPCFRSALKNQALGNLEGQVIESFWPALGLDIGSDFVKSPRLLGYNRIYWRHWSAVR